MTLSTQEKLAKILSFYNSAKEHLDWLKSTGDRTNGKEVGRIVGYEDCLFQWKDTLTLITELQEELKPIDVELLRDMRCQVMYSDKITMPIPLYERMKAEIERQKND